MNHISSASSRQTTASMNSFPSPNITSSTYLIFWIHPWTIHFFTIYAQNHQEILLVIFRSEFRFQRQLHPLFTSRSDFSISMCVVRYAISRVQRKISSSCSHLYDEMGFFYLSAICIVTAISANLYHSSNLPWRLFLCLISPSFLPTQHKSWNRARAHFRNGEDGWLWRSISLEMQYQTITRLQGIAGSLLGGFSGAKWK